MTDRETFPQAIIASMLRFLAENPETPEGGPPQKLNKRQKVDHKDGNAETAIQTACELDMDSDETRPEYKCPICFELFLGEIFQCSSGHLICKQCLEKCNIQHCALCLASLKGKDNQWIRCRALESILDSYWIKCRFQKNGCSKLISRGEIAKHVEECEFDGKCIQICRFFPDGEKCGFWTRVTQPDQVVQHFFECHKGRNVPIGNTLIWNFGSIPLNALHRWKPILVKKDNNCYVISTCLTPDNSFSLVCIQINLPTSTENTEKEIVLRIKSKSAQIKTNIVTQMPVVNVLNSLAILNDPPLRFRRSFLEEHYLDQRKALHVELEFP